VADFGREFWTEAEPVLLQVQTLAQFSSENFVTGSFVGQRQASTQIRSQCQQAVLPSVPTRRAGIFYAHKARAENDIGLAAKNWFQQFPVIPGIILEIAVLDDDQGRLEVGHSRPNRSPFSAVVFMPDEPHARVLCHHDAHSVGGIVRGSIVNHHDLRNTRLRQH
jgi:hypothetical protein